MHIKPIGLINYGYTPRDENKKSHMSVANFISKPEAMSDSFVFQNSDSVAFGGFFDFFKSKKKTPEELTMDILKRKEEFGSSKYHDYVRKIYKNLSSDEKQELLYYMLKHECGGEVSQLYLNRVIPRNDYYAAHDRLREEEAAMAATKKRIEEINAQKAEEEKINLRKQFQAEFNEKYAPEKLDNWTKIVNDMDNDVLKNCIPKAVLENLPSIPYTPENSDEFEKIMGRLKKVDIYDWGVVDEFGNNLAHRAADAGNIPLLNFAIEKDVSLSTPNKVGMTANDYIQQNRDTLSENGLRIHSEELIDFTKQNMVQGVKILLDNPVINVNSLDDKLNSSGIIAAEEGNLEIIKTLNNHKDFDINYVNPNTFECAYSVAKNNEIQQELKQNPRLRKDIDSFAEYCKLFAMFNNSFKGRNSILDIEEQLKNMALDKNIDIDIQTEICGKSLQDVLDSYIDDLVCRRFSTRDRTRKMMYSIIEKYNNLSRLKTLIDTNGVLSLNEIKSYLDVSNVKDIINEPLNDIGEPIGFFVADNSVDTTNILEFKAILDKLESLGYDFSKENEMGQTMLAKAKDAENQFLVEVLQSMGVGK